MSDPAAAISDRPLVLALRRGDPAAFDQVYERHRRRIYGFLRRLAGRRDLADDLFQETWMKLATHATRLDEEIDLAAWLFTVARNQYRSWRRFHLFDAARLRAVAREATDIGADTPERSAASNEGERRIERALAALAPADRELILLVAVEGLHGEQVARMLGIQHDAVRQRVTRARARLAEKLGGAR